MKHAWQQRLGLVAQTARGHAVVLGVRLQHLGFQNPEIPVTGAIRYFLSLQSATGALMWPWRPVKFLHPAQVT